MPQVDIFFCVFKKHFEKKKKLQRCDKLKKFMNLLITSEVYYLIFANSLPSPGKNLIVIT